MTYQNDYSVRYIIALFVLLHGIFSRYICSLNLQRDLNQNNVYLELYFTIPVTVLWPGRSPLREGDGVRHFLGPIFQTFCLL